MDINERVFDDADCLVLRDQPNFRLEVAKEDVFSQLAGSYVMMSPSDPSRFDPKEDWEGVLDGIFHYRGGYAKDNVSLPYCAIGGVVDVLVDRIGCVQR